MVEPPFDRRPLARWPTRVGAWLIDVLLLGAFIAVLGDLLGVGAGLQPLANPLEAGRHGLLLFVYWTLFEASTGQSPGKLALDLQVVDSEGHTPSVIASAIQSFGKAFLLPLDVLVGVLAMRRKRLRLFNKLSGTRVVVLSDEGPERRRSTAVEA